MILDEAHRIPLQFESYLSRLGISFYDFLMDRFLDLNKITRLKDVIAERTQSVVTL